MPGNIAADIQQQLTSEIEAMLTEIRSEMLRRVEALTLVLLEAEQEVVIEDDKEVFRVSHDTFDQIFDVQDSAGFGRSVERGVANATRDVIGRGEFRPQRVLNPVLRRAGRVAGEALADSLFNRGGGGFRLGSSQFGSELLSGLMHSRRNQ